MSRISTRRGRIGPGLLALFLLACPQSDSVPDPNLGPVWRGDDLTSVAVVDSERALVTGRSGAIYRTRDAGRTWTLAREAERPALEDLAMTAEGIGWAVGRRTILRTVDGGRSWQAQALPDTSSERPLTAVASIDSKRAVAVGDAGTRLVTRDGGRRWIDVSVGAREEPTSNPGEPGGAGEEGAADASRLDDVFCLPADRGASTCWIVGDAGAIAWSEDGGESWQDGSIESDLSFAPIELGDGRTDLDASSIERLRLFAEAVRAERDLWLEIEAVTTAREIEGLGRPDDPFALFEILTARAEDARTVLEEAGIEASRLFVRGEPPWDYLDYVDDEPAFLEHYWRAQTASVPGVRVHSIERPDLRAVGFVDLQHGFAVGDEDEIFETRDGGRTWRTAGRAGSHALAALGLAPGHRVLVGAQGAIRVARAEGGGWQAPSSGRAPIHFDDYRDVAFSRDGSFGLIVGDRGWMLRSRDGGVSWEALPLAGQ